MTTRTIRDVDEETWKKLKIMSAEHDATMGIILKKITDDYEERNKEFWNKILKGEKYLTDKEAKDHEALVKKMRKEYGFR
ncbi:MAG: hypothetical protein WC613_06110 [Candidatus Aenigmatarchaeota archaeon]